jgi:hypothetical protein
MVAAEGARAFEQADDVRRTAAKAGAAIRHGWVDSEISMLPEGGDVG